MRLHTSLIELQLTLSCLFICARIQCEEDSSSGTLLEYSFATLLLFVYPLLSVYFVHILVCAYARLYIPLSVILVTAGLLATCSTSLLVWLYIVCYIVTF